MANSILIIAAERGLGLGLAREFFDRGWSVTATARPGSNQDDLKAVGEKDPSRLTTEEVDIVDPDSVDSLERALGDRRFDAIFQNAGVWGPMHQSVLEVTPEEATTLFVTNAMGPARIVRRLLHRLPETGGLIAFMTSQRGSVAENVEGGLELYRASKAALNSLTRSIWADIAPDGRTLLDIHPGWVQTDMGTLGGTVSAEIGLKESVTGVADVVEQRFGTPGHYYVDYQGKLIPW